MKGIAGTQTRGLQQQSELNVIDNTGAKVIEIITVPGYHGVARRSPKAAVGDMVIAEDGHDLLQAEPLRLLRQRRIVLAGYVVDDQYLAADLHVHLVR